MKNSDLSADEIKHMVLDDTVDIGKEPLPVTERDKEIRKWIQENMSLFMKSDKRPSFK